MATRTETIHTPHLEKHHTCCHAPLGSIPQLPTPISSSNSQPALPVMNPVSAMATTTLIGEVLSNHEPRTDGKALIEYRDENTGSNYVLAEVAAGLCVAPGDRVLFVVPSNGLMAVVTTVLPRLSNSNNTSSREASNTTQDPLHPQGNKTNIKNHLVLKDSDALQVTTAAGQMLVAIERGACGPIIRLGAGSIELDIPGEFHLAADSMQFSSRRGPVQINSSTDDVIVKGRTIRLN